jgi:CheY-like chemotaxis protein
MNGPAVVERLKADAGTWRIPVVARTSGTAEHAKELSRAGCIGFIPKPFELATFRRLVAEFLNATVGRGRPIGDARFGP